MPPRRPAPPPRNTPDPDLQRLARRGHGVPSQDPDPRAQQPLQAHERQRELRSCFSGGGLLAGMALGSTAAAWLLGAAGVVWGGMAGAVAGAWAGWALGHYLLAPVGTGAHLHRLAD